MARKIEGTPQRENHGQEWETYDVHAQDVVLRISQPQAQHTWLWAYQDILACTYRTPTTHPHTSVDRHSYNPVDVILPDQSYFVFKIFGA